MNFLVYKNNSLNRDLKSILDNTNKIIDRPNFIEMGKNTVLIYDGKNTDACYVNNESIIGYVTGYARYCKSKNKIKEKIHHEIVLNKIFNNEYIGNNDITYNLSFELLKKIFNKFNLKINGKSNQKSFLINMGILKRAEIISKNLPFSKKADIYYRVQKLINKNSMGEIFKVMLATRDDCNFNSGFIK